MARILVAALPFARHLGPTTALTGELTRRGHEVVAYTGAHLRTESPGATKVATAVRSVLASPPGSVTPEGRPSSPGGAR